METGRIFNKHARSASLQNKEYLLHIKNSENRAVQNESSVDLTTGLSGRHGNPQASGHTKPRSNQAYLQNVDNQAEVIRAAKSLFSKKTRTLYHWMYPNTPKFQLKSAVSLAWDTMGLQEKQFYISQVLGKFGYLQSSLMVNPQLGCMTLPALPQLNLQQPDLTNVETNNAVTNLLQDVNNCWPQMQACSSSMNAKKRGRPRGSKRSQQHGSDKYSRKLHKHGARAADEPDFTDDPELRKELEQFQWTLHLVDK